eukprot:UN21576
MNYFLQSKKPKMLVYSCFFLRATKAHKSWIQFFASSKNQKNMDLIFATQKSSRNMTLIACKLKKAKRTCF